jgi:hypothetical protein
VVAERHRAAETPLAAFQSTTLDWSTGWKSIMFSGNLQGGSDEEADGTMHRAHSVRVVRDSDFVALVA